MLGLLTEKLRRLQRNFQNGACAGTVETESVLTLSLSLSLSLCCWRSGALIRCFLELPVLYRIVVERVTRVTF